MEIIGKSVDINPSMKLTMANLLYFRKALICSEAFILPSSLSRLLRRLCYQCQRFIIAQAALQLYVAEPPN